ncbi:hypothetical protein MA16_Dca014825 [Dendrobium catenatum]|uniref:Uncharacterized protein n=1 Tax=Dendrobium catenatum TaxID=906689 RepID=A0A2I0XB67_9ASPA|nr:hypothetical protein MA16_Dca014825 [Dendrobium catenatum]
MLFYKDFQSDVACLYCNASRFKPKSITKRMLKEVPASMLFYFPIILRLQRLYASMRSAEHMR